MFGFDRVCTVEIRIRSLVGHSAVWHAWQQFRPGRQNKRTRLELKTRTNKTHLVVFRTSISKQGKIVSKMTAKP
jgi:hypothetical protein